MNANRTRRTPASQPRRRSRIPRSVSATQGDGPAYAGQQCTILTVPGNPTLLTTSVAGTIADVYPLDSTKIVSFSSRFGQTFDEYRILRAVVNVRAISTVAGLSVFFFNEKSATAPGGADASERNATLVSNNSANPRSAFSLRWFARDLLDLQYSAIGTNYTPVYFKTFTDAGTYGTTAAVNNLWLVETVFTVEFRGLKAV